MTGRLAGKVCLITGTAGAIGRASALMFAAEGAYVIGCDINENGERETIDLMQRAGYEMQSLHPCNLADKAACLSVVDLAVSTYGRLDVLFNNASKPYFSPIDADDDGPWFETINHELHNVYLLTKAAWPHLCSSHGTVVNMASTAAHTTYRKLPGIAHCAAKGGVVAMTRQLALEGRGHGVRVNSLSPGVIETPATLERAKDPAWAEAMTSRIMRGTLGQPREIAAAALFLASDESSFVNAADLIVDGGTTAWG